MSNLAKNSALYLVSTVVLKATSFLLLPLYSNLIPPEAYGKVYLVSSYVTFFSIFMTFSMQGAMQRFFFDCKSDNEIKELYSTIVIFVFGISSVTAALLLVFNNTIAGWMNLPPVYLLLATATVYLSAFYNLILALLYAQQQAVTISVVSIVCGVLSILTQLTLVLTMQDKAFALVLTMLVGGVMHFALFLWFSRKYLVLKFNRIKLKSSVYYGLSQFPSDISTFIVSLSDRFILNKYKNSGAVGIYGMGNTLGTIPQVLFSSMNSALAPIIFTNYTDRKEGKVPDISYSCSLIEKVSILLTIIITLLIVFSNNIVAILSDKYQQSGFVMFLVLFAVLIDIYRKLFMYPIAYEVKYVKVKSAIWILASALSIGLNLILIPKYSYYGACVSLICANSLTLGLILIASNKAMHPKYKVGKLALILTLSIICSMSFFLGFSWGMIPVKMVIVAVYLVFVYMIYPIDYKEMFSFIKFKRKLLVMR